MIKNTREEVIGTLREIAQFIAYAEKRAHQLLQVKEDGVKFSIYADSYSIDDDGTGIYFTFTEDTRHDCPDRGGVQMEAWMIALSDKEWDALLDSHKLAAIEAKAEELAKLEKERLLAKENLFQKLKKELGYDDN